MRNEILALLLAAVLLLSAGCGSQSTSVTVEDSVGISVETISPEIGNIIVVGEYIGVLESNQQVTVFSRAAGEVEAVYFSVGDTVEEGDILFSIHAADILNNIVSLEAQLQVHDATVRAAQTGVSLVDGSALQSQILSAAGGVNQAETAIAQAEHSLEQALLGIEQAQMGYDLAEQAFRDSTTLFEAGVIARNTYEQAETAFSNAQTALERAIIVHSTAEIALAQAVRVREQALEGQRIINEQTPFENTRRAQDALEQAQAARNTILVNLQIANERLNDTYVRTPISGVVERRNVEPFNMTSPQSPAFIIANNDSMTVSFKVPRNAHAFIEIGDEVILNDGVNDYSGFISEISTTVDAHGLFTIKATIPNPPENFFNGASIRVSVEVQKAVNVPIVPLDVIQYQNGIPHVFIAQDGFARRVMVEVGIFDAQNIQILSGVESTDQIIRTWSSRISDGTEIISALNEGGDLQ